MKMPKKRPFRSIPYDRDVKIETGYILGSHIRKGLYEPVSAEQSALMRGAYDEPDSKHTDVDPLNSYRYDKFELAKMQGAKVAPNPAPKDDE